MTKEEQKYDYNRFGSKGQRVGQAVVDIMSRENAPQTVEETLDAFGPDYAKELDDTIELNKGKYKSPFYVLVLMKKEMWAVNVLRNYFIARQTPPYALDLIQEYPNYTKTLYQVDSVKGNLKLVWSIPGHSECISILKTPGSFDEDLVKWIIAAYGGKLELDAYNL
jgi:hypothetical protein